MHAKPIIVNKFLDCPVFGKTRFQPFCEESVLIFEVIDELVSVILPV